MFTSLCVVSGTRLPKMWVLVWLSALIFTATVTSSPSDDGLFGNNWRSSLDFIDQPGLDTTVRFTGSQGDASLVSSVNHRNQADQFNHRNDQSPGFTRPQIRGGSTNFGVSSFPLNGPRTQDGRLNFGQQSPVFKTLSSTEGGAFGSQSDQRVVAIPLDDQDGQFRLRQQSPIIRRQVGSGTSFGSIVPVNDRNNQDSQFRLGQQIPFGRQVGGAPTFGPNIPVNDRNNLDNQFRLSQQIPFGRQVGSAPTFGPSIPVNDRNNPDGHFRIGQQSPIFTRLHVGSGNNFGFPNGPVNEQLSPDGQLNFGQQFPRRRQQGSSSNTFGFQNGQRDVTTFGSTNKDIQLNLRQQSPSFRRRQHGSNSSTLGSQSGHLDDFPSVDSKNTESQLSLRQQSPIFRRRQQGFGSSTVRSQTDHQDVDSTDKENQLNLRQQSPNFPKEHEEAIFGSPSEQRPIVIPAVEHLDQESKPDIRQSPSYTVLRLSGLNLLADDITTDHTRNSSHVATTTTASTTATTFGTTTTTIPPTLNFSTLFKGGLKKDMRVEGGESPAPGSSSKSTTGTTTASTPITPTIN
nr:uncharacterized protein LOC128699832 [Cherax quadricarinatus]